MREELARVMDLDREEALAKLVGDQFGIALSSLSPSVVRSLLEALPDDPYVADRRMLERILSACSIGETMFLRHAEHFAALEELLPTLPSLLSGGDGLRVWSAGCASGEEAYSLSATLARHGYPRSTVLATDLNPAAIARARDARYRLWSLRGVELDDVEGWLQIDGLDVAVRPAYQASVRFEVLNLARDAYPEDLDLVFCRNVLMYFQPESAETVLRRMAYSVRPGGALFIGYVDPTPSRTSGWMEERIAGVRCFRRREGESAAIPRPRPVLSVVPGRPAPRSIPHPQPARVRPSPACPAPPALEEIAETMAMARGLAAQRAFEDAIRVIQEATALHPLDPEPYALLALVAEEASLSDLALSAARRCCFLAPEAAVAHFLVGACLKRRGEPHLAHRRLRHARGLLDRVAEADQPLPYGEGLTSRQLRRMIDVQLADFRV